MKDDVFELISSGESQTLEFKVRMRDPLLLAKIICSFANSDGGKILIGVNDTGNEIAGVNEGEIDNVYAKAIKLLSPEVNSNLEFVKIRIILTVAIIEVKPSKEVVLADGGAYMRNGVMTQPMAASQLITKLPNDINREHVEPLTRAIEHQTKTIDLLHEKVDEANSWQSKWKGYLVSGVVGMVFSLILTLLVG